QEKLLQGYCQAYYQLANQLYNLDRTNPHAARAVVQCELPNLLRAVHLALQSGRNEEGVDFADSVNRFLRVFGLRRDAEALTEAAGKAGGTVGSQAWYLAQSNLGEQLRQNGQPGAAAQVFANILAGLEETPSYNRCLTLTMLGRCSKAQGQLASAEQLYRQELDELAQLELNEQIRRQIGITHGELADVLCNQKRYNEAKTAYQVALEIMKDLDDMRSVAVVTGQLGTVAYLQDELAAMELDKAGGNLP
ncbi:MAG: hypothetical protein D3905_17065, partial [Candidatus Electrothrix sp. AS4_5]|nr:hypothetical protein [Candidatus Electrothrix gigas]